MTLRRESVLTPVRLGDFQKFISTLRYANSQFKMFFDEPRFTFFSEKGKVRYSFEIKPPWRILLERKIHIASHEFPRVCFIADTPEKQQLFSEWKERTAFLESVKIKSITLSDFCDFTVEWENEATLHAFCDDMAYPSCYFYIQDTRIFINFKEILIENNPGLNIFKIPKDKDEQENDAVGALLDGAGRQR